MKLYFLLVFFLLFGVIAKPQETMPGLRVFTQGDGYPAQTGYLINQDSLGFIWVGTDQGAVRYDGINFELFDVKFGLKDREVLEAKPISGNRIVFAPLLNSLACFKDDKLIPDSILRFNEVLNKTANILFVDAGTLWLGDVVNDKMLYKLEGARLEKQEIELDEKFSLEAVFGDTLLISTWDTFTRVNFIHYISSSKKTILLKGYKSEWEWSTVRLYGRGKMLVASSSNHQKLQIFKIVNHELQLQNEYELKDEVKQILTDKNNHLWLSFTHPGLQYWGKIENLHSKSRPLKMMQNSIINDVLVDRDDNIWMTTETQGLYFISRAHWASFLRYQKLNLPWKKPKIISKSSNGSILIIGPGGELSTIRNGSKITFLKGNLLPKSVQALYCSKSMDLVDLNPGLAPIYLSDIEFELNDILFEEGMTLKDVCFSETGEYFYVAWHAEVTKYNASDPLEKITVFKGRSTSVKMLNKTDLLIGTPSGLFVCKAENKAERVDYKQLEAANISCIEKYGKGDNFLIGTSTNGLFLYRSKKEAYIKLPLPIEVYTFIRKIVVEGELKFWLITDLGVLEVNHDGDFNNLSVAIHNESSGLFSNDVQDLVLLKDTAYVLNRKGMNIILPKDEQNNNAPKPLIYRVELENRTLFNPNALHLESNENEIEVAVKTFQFENKDHSPVFYKLKNYHNRWSKSESGNFNLHIPPGRNQLLVKAKNSRSEDTLILPITVEAAIWEVPLFWIGIALVFLALFGWLLYVFQKKRQLKIIHKLENQNQLAQLELEAIKAHINPHFVYNCLNSIQYLSRSGNAEVANKYISSFSSLLRQTMHLSQQTFITVEKEVAYLRNYLDLEKMRFRETLNYNISLPLGINKYLFPAMLLQLFVENAIKHATPPVGEPKYISLSFTEEGERLKVLIWNNGNGWDSKKKKEIIGLGMRMAKGRANAYKQLFGTEIDINIESNFKDSVGTGTRIELLIPVKHEDNCSNSG